jgi:hypothetical protein
MTSRAASSTDLEEKQAKRRHLGYAEQQISQLNAAKRLSGYRLSSFTLFPYSDALKTQCDIQESKYTRSPDYQLLKLKADIRDKFGPAAILTVAYEIEQYLLFRVNTLPCIRGVAQFLALSVCVDKPGSLVLNSPIYNALHTLVFAYPTVYREIFKYVGKNSGLRGHRCIGVPQVNPFNVVNGDGPIDIKMVTEVFADAVDPSWTATAEPDEMVIYCQFIREDNSTYNLPRKVNDQAFSLRITGDMTCTQVFALAKTEFPHATRMVHTESEVECPGLEEDLTFKRAGLGNGDVFNLVIKLKKTPL